MKTPYMLLIVGALTVPFGLPARVSASPGGFSGHLSPYQTYAADGVTGTYRDQLLVGGPRRWSFGAYAELQRRQIEPRQGGPSTAWDTDNLMLSAGYDILPWLTLLGAGGRSDLSLDDSGYGADPVWLLGARIRLLDFFVFDPFKITDLHWCRLDAVVHYWGSKVERVGSDIEWDELRTALTLGFVSRPKRLGYLDSAGIFVGPVYSRLTLRESLGFGGRRMHGRDDLGMVAGVFVNPTRNTVLKAELYRFERNSLNLAAGFHF